MIKHGAIIWAFLYLIHLHAEKTYPKFRFIQNLALLLSISGVFCAPGLVKFVPAVARLFCLALPGSFLTMFAQNKGDLCTGLGSKVILE